MFGENERTFLSDFVEVRYGVPQGIVSGPTLSNIFIYDAPSNIKNKISLYSDNSKVIGLVENSEEIETFQADLDSFTCWSETWNLEFNVQKC